MKPIITEELKTNTFIVFSKKGNKFLGWILKKDKNYISRPANNWKELITTSKSKSERYLIATIK